MTTSLKKAFAKAADLPKPVQEELAEQLLEDIQGELKWDKTLASPKSQKLLRSLAEKAQKPSGSARFTIRASINCEIYDRR